MSGVAEPKLTVGLVAAVVIGVALALPLYLPIPGLEGVPVLAQAAAVAAAFLVLPVQLAADAGRPRRGSAIRLVVLGMGTAAVIAWGAGAIQYGLGFRSLISLLNWIALGALVVCGQVLFGTERRVALLVTGWATAYAVASAVVVAYLVSRFGAEILLSTNRGPFQTAGRGIFLTWPNYFGVAAAVGACIFYGHILRGRAAIGSWTGLSVLLLTIVITFSRTAWIACAAGLIVMTASSGRLRHALRFLTVGLLFSVFVAARFPAVRYQFVATLTTGTSQQLRLLDRLAYAAEAVRLRKENPLLGVGFHGFDEFVSVSQVIARTGQPDAIVGSVHNEYLSTLLKGGLLVATSFLVFLAAAVRALRRLSWQASVARYIGIIGLGITTVLLVAGVAMESFRTVAVSGPFWVLVGAVSMFQNPATAAALPLAVVESRTPGVGATSDDS